MEETSSHPTYVEAVPDMLKTVNPESSKEFIRLAVKYATEHSDDAFTKNGAILVTKDR